MKASELLAQSADPLDMACVSELRIKLNTLKEALVFFLIKFSQHRQTIGLLLVWITGIGCCRPPGRWRKQIYLPITPSP